MLQVAEFGDTLLIVLRKKELRLIQYYHHLMTMLYCWCHTPLLSALSSRAPPPPPPLARPPHSCPLVMPRPRPSAISSSSTVAP